MTPLDNRIDEDFVARYYRGEAIVLEGQLEDVDGAIEQLDGLTFFAVIMMPDGDELRRMPAAILHDTSGPYFQAVFDGEVSTELYGQSALRWALGQYVAGRGNQVIVEGPLILRPGPVARAIEGAQGAAAIAHRFVRRLTTTGRSTVRISNMGPRGLSPWEAEGKTREQYQADVGQLAVEAGTQAALQQVGEAITELGEFTSQRSADVDDAIVKTVDAGARADSKAKYAGDQGDYAKAQGLALGDAAGQAERSRGFAQQAAASAGVADNFKNQIFEADRLGKMIPKASLDQPASFELIPNSGNLGKMILAFLDQAGFLGAGITADGTLAAGKLRALASILTPLLGIDAGGSLALGANAKLAFAGNGKITSPTGTTMSLQGANYDFAICDENNNVLFGLMKGKVYGPRVATSATDKRINIAYGTGVTIDMGAHNYDVCICDQNGNVLLGWMNGVFYSPIGATGTVNLDAQDAADKSFTTSVHSRRVTNISRPTSAYVLQFVYGQSLAQGDETWPALSRTNRFGNVMLGASVQPLGGSSTYRPVGGVTALQPLAAITIDNSNTLYPDETTTQASGGARGEPVNHGWANGSRYSLAQYVLTEDYTARRFVSLNVGVSGATIGELEKNHTEGGTESYGRYTDAIGKVKAIADGEGKSVTVGGIVYMQGEHDYAQASGHTSLNITYAAYRAKLEGMIANMQADAMALTGQPTPPPFLMYQTGAAYTRAVDSAGTPGMHVGMAQLDVALASKTAWMVGPVYPYPDKGGHLDSNGSRWFGHQIAKVHHRIAVEGRGWQPLRPVRIWQEGTNTLYVAYHVPHAPLVFDAPQLSGGSEYNNTNRGFRVSDAVGNVAVTEAVIVRDTIIKLTCARALSGPANVWYASQGTGGNGMVRDSDPALAADNYVYEPERGMLTTANIARFVGKPYPLWNWSVAFFLPVGFKEQA